MSAAERRRLSVADRLRVARSALARLARPAITPGQGRTIRGRRTHEVIRSSGEPPVTLSGPPLDEPDGGRRGD